MIDHFTKYGWIVPLKVKTVKSILSAFKKCIPTIMFQHLQSDNKTELKNSIINKILLEINIQHIFGTPYNSQH